MKGRQRGNKSYGILNYPLTCSKPATRPVRREKQKNWMSGCILLADTRPWGIYQLLVFFFFLFFFWHGGIWDWRRLEERRRVKWRRRERERERGKKAKQTRLIVMLNLRVNDTITMPTPCYRHGNQLYCIDSLEKSPPPPMTTTTSCRCSVVVCVCVCMCVFNNPCAATCLVLSRGL